MSCFFTVKIKIPEGCHAGQPASDKETDMTEHSHTLPSQQALKHRLEDVQRKLARAEKENSEHAHALRAEVKKLEAQLQD